jgi:hypothetical protein
MIGSFHGDKAGHGALEALVPRHGFWKELK